MPRMRYVLLGIGIGLLLASFLLFYTNMTEQEVLGEEEEGLVVRVFLLGGGEEVRGETFDYFKTPSLTLPPRPAEEEEERLEEEAVVDEVEAVEEAVEAVEEERVEEVEEEREEEVLLATEPVMERIFIPYTTPVSRIIEMLMNAELIHDDEAFMERLKEMGVVHLLQAGEYFIPQGTPPTEIIMILLGQRGEDD